MFWIRHRKKRISAENLGARHSPFFWAGDRRYLSDVAYALPKDDKETDRLDFQHYMLRYVMRGNYKAPIRTPLNILDVGTGTGRWANDVGQQFSRAAVFGIDVVEPKRPPEHYTFRKENVVEGLSFADNSFDFVHQRLLVAALTPDNWHKDVQELARVTQPRGWIELVEGDYSRKGGPALHQINVWVDTAFKARGIDFSMGGQIGNLLRQAGLTNVQQRTVIVPMGKWGGRIGEMMQLDYFTSYAALRNLVVAMNIAPGEQYDKVVEAARQEVEHGQIEVPFFVAYGQKP